MPMHLILVGLGIGGRFSDLMPAVVMDGSCVRIPQQTEKMKAANIALFKGGKKAGKGNQKDKKGKQQGKQKQKRKKAKKKKKSEPGLCGQHSFVPTHMIHDPLTR